MHEGHCRHQLFEDGAGLLLSEAVSLAEPVQQLPAPYQLRDDVDVEGVSEHINKMHYVGMSLAELQDLDLTTGVVSTSTN